MTTTLDLERGTNFTDFTRAEIRVLADRYTFVSINLAKSDPRFIARFCEMLPNYSLGAVLRDAGGISATVCDINTVANAVATTPELWELHFPNGMHAAEWEWKIGRLIREHKIRQAASHVGETLRAMAQEVLDYPDDDGRQEAEALSLKLLAFAACFAAGPDPVTGFILTPEEIAWWGLNKELVWAADGSHLIEVRDTEFASIYQKVSA